jgi:hypothetical protein
MLFFLIILILLSAVAAAAVISISRRRQKSLPSPSESQLHFQPIQYQSIFAPDAEEIRAFEAEDKAKRSEMLRQKILAKAETGDFGALNEAKDFEFEFYDRVLRELAVRCDGERFASLALFIEERKLPANAALIGRFQDALENSAGKKDAIRFLHLAALSRSAEIFSDSVESVIKLCREDKLEGFTQTNLIQLAESQFWLLPTAEKTSGAAFLLKQKLAKLRSEVQEKQ